MYFTTDTIGDAVTSGDSASTSFDFDEASTVTIDNQPWARAFDTDEFHKFEVVVARPIEQTYVVDGEEHTFKKPFDELREATWSLDNAPYPLTHPNTRVVTDVDDIHGFHRNPRAVRDYDANGDAVVTDLYVPTTDEEARSFIEQFRAVSVGVYNDLDWDTDEDGVDAYQTNLYFDHVAGVRRGRCSIEDGCGITTDTTTVAMDGVATTALSTDAQFSVGDTVKWSWSGGMAHGRIASVATEEGESLSAEGTTRAAKADRPAYKIEVYREEDGEYSGHAVKLEGENDLSSWKGPTADSCSGVCHCGCHVTVPTTDDGHMKSVEEIDLTPPQAAQDAAQRVLDARSDDDTDVSGMREHGWSRAEQLAGGEELSPTDIVGSSGSMAPWWSRHAPHTIEESDGSYSLARDESIDEWYKDNSYVAGLGWGGVTGYKWAIRKGNEIKRARNADPNYELDSANDSMTTVAGVSFRGTRDGELDESEIPSEDYESHYLYDGETKSESSYPVVDAEGYLRRGNVEAAHMLGARGGVDEDEHEENLRALARRFEGLTLYDEDFASITVDESPFSFDTISNTTMSEDNSENESIDFDGIVGGMTVDAVAEHNDNIAELVADRDEKADRIEVLEDKVEALEADLDDAEDKLESFENGERRPKSAIVDSITDLTSAWDEDELMDLDHDELLTKETVAEDAAQSPSTPSDDGGNNESTTDNADDEIDLDEHRSWR